VCARHVWLKTITIMVTMTDGRFECMVSGSRVELNNVFQIVINVLKTSPEYLPTSNAMYYVVSYLLLK